MIPKIHKKGRSFRSTAGYLLHDVGAKSAARVAWTTTRNLATRNADLAWRVMAATALDQHRLKLQAGVKNTGRKSDQHVLHFTLSWHPDEAPTLNQAEMLRAVTTVLHVMRAQDHQCLVVAHNDQPQPHVHVVVNRVHPRDGRILSSSFEKLRTSRWAEQYEKERGKIYCTERVLNNAARERGEYTRGEKDEPRPVHETLAAANDNQQQRQQLLAEHRARAAVVRKEQQLVEERHRQAWRDFEARQHERRALLLAESRSGLARRLTQLRHEYKPRWSEQHHAQAAEQRLFEQRETKVLGRVQNALRSIDVASLVGRGKPADDGRVRTLGEAFQVLADAGARKQALDQQQALAREQLRKEQQQTEDRLRREAQDKRDAELAQARKRLETERSDLLLKQSLEQARLKAQWQTNREQLRTAVRELKALEHPPLRTPVQTPAQVAPPEPAKPRLTPVFQAAAQGPAEPVRSESDKAPQRPVSEPTKPSDLVPSQGAAEAARRIDEWRELRRHPRGPGRHPDRDDEIER